MCRTASAKGEPPERSLPSSFGRITLMNTYGEMSATARRRIRSFPEGFFPKKKGVKKGGSTPLATFGDCVFVKPKTEKRTSVHRVGP